MGSSRPGLRGVRRPTHAGSWYEGDPDLLRDELQTMLGAEYAEGAIADPKLKAVISPHAGLRYSGSVAAGVFARLDAETVKQVVLIGPSHHAYLEGCALPGEEVTKYRTPLGDLPLNLDTLAELRKTQEFSFLPMDVDEAEHSIEMQLPFLALLLQNPKRPVTLVPMLVGQVDAKSEAKYGRLLAPLLMKEGTVFVISSDFCHWGAQFGYTRVGSPGLAKTYRDGPHPDNARIEGLDREGMALIEQQDADGFRKYLHREGNTICGRHPILVLLETLAATGGEKPVVVDFVKYAQSSAMPGMPPPRNASVSYACALCRPIEAHPKAALKR